MTIEELTALALPIARRLREMQSAMIAEQSRLFDLIEHQRVTAASLGVAPASPSYRGVLLTFAAYDLGHCSAEEAASSAARIAGCEALHESPASLALPAGRRLELLLSQRFLSQMEGN